ncbi:MAG: PorT family protein [Crocinitomicaceae bacterium TMED209]|nr:MAG: PorT family protein [Crocinitomicaceae bacterium TMED209]
MKYRSWSSVCRFTTHSRLMYPSALFNLFPSRKHLLAIGVALMTALGPVAAQQGRKNLAAFDTKKYHFGFAISGNRSDFNLALTPDYSFSDSLQSIINQPQAGFDLGLVASWDATKNLHVRFIPGLSFQDRSLEYRFEEDGGTDLKVRRTESVYLNFPLLLKLRTDRVGNYAAYALFGAKFSRDMQSQEETNQQLASDFILRLESGNSSIDLGAGVDIFLPFFKFSIEGKFELGNRNILIQDDSQYSAPLQSLKTRSFILSLCFEG